MTSLKSPINVRLVLPFLIILVAVFLAACERPFQDTEVADLTTAVETDQTAVTDDGAGDSEGDVSSGETADTAETQEGGGNPDDVATDATSTEGSDTTDAAATESSEASDDSASEATDESSQTSSDETADQTTTNNESTETADTQESSESSEEPQTTESSTDTSSTSQTATASDPIVHTVVAGENLYRIGLRYGVSWVTLAQVNNLPNANVLVPGQKITIPGSAPNPNPTPTPVPTDETTYVVKAGDSLFRIGILYNVDWRQIAEANGIVNPNYIKVGQVLKIPTSQPGPTPTFTHEVQRGEYLFSIALKYGVKWEDIAAVNQIAYPHYIYPGQKLEIPGTATNTESSGG